MEAKVGIKESKELIIAIDKVVRILIERLKDGFQVDDVTNIISRLATDSAFLEGVKGLSILPSEVKDFDLNEGVEIGLLLLGFLPGWINSAKKV